LSSSAHGTGQLIAWIFKNVIWFVDVDNSGINYGNAVIFVPLVLNCCSFSNRKPSDMFQCLL